MAYDIEEIMTAIETSELSKMSYIMAKIVQKELKTGINYLEESLILIHEISSKNNFSLKNFEIPEEYWLEAAKTLNIV